MSKTDEKRAEQPEPVCWRGVMLQNGHMVFDWLPCKNGMGHIVLTVPAAGREQVHKWASWLMLPDGTTCNGYYYNSQSTLTYASDHLVERAGRSS